MCESTHSALHTIFVFSTDLPCTMVLWDSYMVFSVWARSSFVDEFFLALLLDSLFLFTTLSVSIFTYALTLFPCSPMSLARARSLPFSVCVHATLHGRFNSSYVLAALDVEWNPHIAFSLNWAVNRDRNDLRRFIVDRHRCRVFIFVSTTVSFCQFIITRSIYISFRSYIFTYRIDLKSKHSFLFDTFCSFSFLRLSFDKQLKYSTLWTKLKLKQQQPKKSAAHTTRVNIQTKRNKTMKIEI